MSAFLDMTHAVTSRYHEKIKKSLAYLFNLFKLSNFGYYKITNSGEYTYFGTHVGWSEYFAAEKLYETFPYYRHPKYAQIGVSIWSSAEKGPFLDTLNFARDKFNIYHGLATIRKIQNGVEGFVFCPNSSEVTHLSFLINSLQMFDLFIKKFREDNENLFHAAEENRIDLRKLMGPVFFERSVPVICQENVKQAFLQEMGIESGNFTPVESDVAKLLLKGYSASQIGKQFYRSKRTIEHHIERIKEKLSCHSRCELVQKVRELEGLGIFSSN